MPGFGIRVAPSGLKTWIVIYRRPSGNASRMKLGSYPAVALADARLAARRALGGIQIDHRDPMAERAAERNAETFAQLADEYLRRWIYYIDPEQRQSWLISPNDASAGNAPRDWIIEGRPRDLLWEFRRMQVGEPV